MGQIGELIERLCDDLVHGSAKLGYTFGYAYLRNSNLRPKAVDHSRLNPADRISRAADTLGVVLGWVFIAIAYGVLGTGVHLGPGGTVAAGILVLISDATD